MSTIDATFDLAVLRERCAGTVAGPADENYDQVRQAWNLAVDQRPAAVAVVEDAADVQAVVAFAAAHGLRVTAQGTGHNAGPLAASGMADTILVRTDRMRDVEIDASAKRARVGAGALWGDVTTPASEHHLAPLAGSAHDVGVVGYVLGGGLSWLARKKGLACNSVTAIEIVTADGELRRCDHEHETDLFWALRGGGGNFGVVTAVELELHAAHALQAGMLVWPWEQAREVLHAYREWTLTAPEEFTTSIRILQIPPLEELPEMIRGRNLIAIDGAYLADPDSCAAWLAPLRALHPEIDTFGPVPPVALSYVHMDPPEPVPSVGDGMALAELTPEAVDAFLAVTGPDSGSILGIAEIRHVGGAVRRAQPGAGVLATFDADYLIFAGAMPMDADHARRIVSSLGELFGALSPWDAGVMYQNFAESTRDQEQFFGPERLNRLREIKAQIDPQAIFRANHSLS